MIDELTIEQINPQLLDEYLEKGWRHFGTYFFRYILSVHNNQYCIVVPLRIRLENYTLTKSQRKLMKKNEGFRHEIKPIEIDEERILLFERHKKKFKSTAPVSIYEFLSYENPAWVPCEGKELDVYDEDKLIAVSFFDVSEKGISSIYGMFDLDYSDRRLGIYTMLLEVEYAIQLKKTYYYHGYSYNISSFYDYKKRFNGLEAFDWRVWKPMERLKE